MGCCQIEKTNDLLTQIISKKLTTKYVLNPLINFDLRKELENQYVKSRNNSNIDDNNPQKNEEQIYSNQEQYHSSTNLQDEKLEISDKDRSVNVNGTGSNEKTSLELSILESKYLDPTCKIIITPSTIKQSGQEKFYFGKNLGTNYFNFPNEESVAEIQFEIMYDNKIKVFQSKDCSNGTGLFIKINEKMVLNIESIVSFSNAHMLVTPNHNNSNLLKIKFIQGVLKERSFIFDPIQSPTNRIGRSKTNEIPYKDETVSRVQCTFSFENNKWILYDGVPSKPSTNGIWLLANKYYTLREGSLLKTGNTTFVVKLK